MQQKWKTAGTMVVAALAAACASGPRTTTNGLPESGPAHPVHQVFMDGIAAFNAQDLDTFMQQWDEDVQMYAADAGWLRGRSAVRQRFATTFASFPDARMEIDSLRVTAVARDVATVDFRFRVHPMGTGPAFHGVGSGTYVLRDRWVEVLVHESVTRVDPELRRP